MKSRLTIRHVGSLILLASLIAACSPGGGGSSGAGKAPEADYGDAPDGGATNYAAPFAQAGSFPSLFASDGARVLDVEQAYLGGPGSAEKDADDANDPDGAPNLTNADSDDGLVDMFITLVSIPPPTTITVNVSAPEIQSWRHLLPERGHRSQPGRRVGWTRGQRRTGMGGPEPTRPGKSRRNNAGYLSALRFQQRPDPA